MNNQQVIDAFVNERTGRSSNGNLYSTGGKLINYSTCIAQRIGRQIIFNRTRYSVSTSKIQSWTAGSLRGRVKEISGVPMGERDLARYV